MQRLKTRLEGLKNIRKDCNWMNTVFSSAFVINGRFEMGRKLLKPLVSREEFLRRGVTLASLRLSGIVPETRDLFRNDTKLGPTESKICFKIRGGRTSWEQKEGFKWSIVSLRDWRETGSKSLHIVEEQQNSGDTLASGCSWDLRVVILSQKNLEKPSHNDTEGFEITFTGGFNTEFRT